MLSNRDWIPTLKLAGVKMPDIFNVKYYSFYIRLRCFPKVTLMAKPTERNEIWPILKKF